MRKIFCYTPELLETFRKDFIRDTQKFFRASRITESHLETPFELKGNMWQLVGQADEKEMVCKNLDNNSYWAIERMVVQRCLIGEVETKRIESPQKMKPVKKAKV